MKGEFKPIFLLQFIVLFSLGCKNPVHNKEEVEKAMQTYDQLILNMDVDSISYMYTPDGDLGNIAHGRDSIRNLLEKFKHFKVLSQISRSDSVLIDHDTAIQVGIYHQTTIVSANDTESVNGTFRVRWIWSKETGWQIKHMETASAK
jgi:ketosteroid isomerase-like protein